MEPTADGQPIAAMAELAATIEQRTMLRDRHGLWRRLRSVQAAAQAGRSVDAALGALSSDVARSHEQYQQRRAALPRPTFAPELPIVEHRAAIARAIADHPVVIICGQTGSGKTTQIPKICLELGRGAAGMIVHTQPRRIAARSVAARLSQELGSPLGGAVGFKVRFADRLSEQTCIKLVTDGVLLGEIQRDRYLSDYDTIILDEAHERSLNIDFLLGYLKQLLPRRPELKLIITSATIDPERFSRHFDDAPILSVSGRMYPVEVRYRPLKSRDADERELELPQAVIAAVDELWRHSGSGDTLVFLTGERDIRQVAAALHQRHAGDADVLPLYARLSADEQMRIFAAHQRPRIVLATNVAETSLTVPGIRYVIDSGLARVSRYSPRSKVQRLPIEPVSRASADQRKGRCGRLGPGVCVRLYDEADYLARPEFAEPEILHTNLASVILQMKAFGLGRLEEFPFIDPPNYRQVRDGYQTLHELGAIDEHNELTDIGRTLARLPIDPRIGRMILAARAYEALSDVLILAAALSVQDPRERPMDKPKEADEAHNQFREGTSGADRRSDFMAMLNLWRWYDQASARLSASRLRQACKSRYLSLVRLREWQDVLGQLRELVAQMGWHIGRQPAGYEAIHRSVLSGLLGNTGAKAQAHAYEGVGGKQFHLFPGSALFHVEPPWVMAAELVETARVYARTVAQVKPEWIEHAAEHLVQRSWSDAHWQRRSGRVVAYERVTLGGLAVVPKRTVLYGPIDPVSAREIFIQSALVAGDYDTDAPWARHNRQLIRELELMEAKSRRRDILVDSKTQFAFYDARLPAGISTAKAFEKWRHKAEAANRRALWMSRDDLMARSADEVNEAQFPPMLDVGSLRLPLSYRFDPGHPLDGVTATVKLAELNQVPGERLDWLVPGLIEEKAIDLIRTLPKPVRVNLVPVPEFAHRSVSAMAFGQGALLDALAWQLGKLTGIPITADMFRPEELADYLRMNVRVVDETGKTVGMGRDIEPLRTRLRDKAKVIFERLPESPYVRNGITEWDFGDLPQRVELPHRGSTVQGFPAIIDQGNAVGLRLLDTADAARVQTRAGVRRLFILDYQRELMATIEQLPDLPELERLYASLALQRAASANRRLHERAATVRERDLDPQPGPPTAEAHGSLTDLPNEMLIAVADRLLFADSADVRTRMEFELRLAAAWNKLVPVATDIARIARAALEAYGPVAARLSEELAPLLAEPVADLRGQLAALMPPTFLSATPYEWLVHLPRYLGAMTQRLTKLTNAGLLRDLAHMALIAPLWDAYVQRRAEHERAGIFDVELERFRWAIEELRVSLFAQELKTAIPVSVQRLQRQLSLVRSA